MIKSFSFKSDKFSGINFGTDYTLVVLLFAPAHTCSCVPFQILWVVDLLKRTESWVHNPAVCRFPWVFPFLWNIPWISLKVLHTQGQRPFPKYSIIMLLPIKFLVGQRTTVVQSCSPLPKLHLNETTHICHWIVHSGLHHSHSHQATWLPSISYMSMFSTLLPHTSDYIVQGMCLAMLYTE